MNVIDEKYQNGKIYKIICNLTGETYYGSTTQELNNRMNQHKNKKKYCRSKQIINRGNYYYEFIEDYSCNNRKELETRERWYIENNECINKSIPTRTYKEYYENNKEKLLEKQKIWYEDNKEIIREKQNEKITCDICGGSISRSHLKRHQRTKKCLSKIDG